MNWLTTWNKCCSHGTAYYIDLIMSQLPKRMHTEEMRYMVEQKLCELAFSKKV